MIDASSFTIAATVGIWLLATLVVLAACRTASLGDTAIRTGGSGDGALLRLVPDSQLTSEALATEHVGNRAQHDLDVPPERPVRHVEVVDRPHLPQRHSRRA